jgi:hypothetical protein
MESITLMEQAGELVEAGPDRNPVTIMEIYFFAWKVIAALFLVGLTILIPVLVVVTIFAAMFH